MKPFANSVRNSSTHIFQSGAPQLIIKRCYKTGAEGSRMADVVQDIWLKEFEELGEDQVRERTAAGIWGVPDKARLARQWLELRSTSLAREANDLARRANDAAREANDIARTNNIIAMFALGMAGMAIAVSIIGPFLKGS